MIFETDRFYLRRMTLADATDMFILDSNPNVHRYLGNNPVSSVEQSKTMIKDILAQYESVDMGRLAIIRKEDQAFVGWSGLKYERQLRDTFDYYDLGYRLKEEYWGQGIATEVAKASLRYGFMDRNLTKICAGAHVDNGASAHILTKIGMIQKDDFTFENILCHWYELTREEWLKQQSMDEC